MSNKIHLCGIIYCPLIALLVSSDIIAHYKELKNNIFTASGDTYLRQFLQCSDSTTTPAGSDVRMYHQKL
jgi:hypothetical protein